jgi:7-cyano-7-deazaguanine synthase
MKTAVCLLSGGIDSAVALWWARARGWDAVTVSYLFDGRPEQEVMAARRLSRAAGAREHREVRLPFAPSEIEAGDRPQGYLPRRNLVFYSIAASLGESIGAEVLIGGHLATDGLEFPDASQEYFQQVERLINGAPPPGPDVRPVKILLPLIGMSKADAVKLGRELHCPLELSWSCFRDGPQPCEKCGACRERRESLDGVAGSSRRTNGEWRT